MANPEHVDILKQGVEVWNQWRKEHPDIKPDFSGANLSNIYLGRVINLSEANLYRTDLRKAFLYKPDLYRANLSEALLREAFLYGADCRQASLLGADLHEADLSNADFTGANLRDTDLTRADLHYADLASADLTFADLSGADLTSANLHSAMLVETNLAGATLSDCNIFGISSWKVNLEGAKQDNLDISDYSEPTITVDNLEVAQFIYLLLNHKKLRDVFNTMTERGVLILGRFGGGGLEVLQAIAAKLREEHYLPIIFDFDRPQDRNYTETVKTLAGLTRFVIADLSGPSVPQELYATVPHFKIPFVPIIEAGRKPFAMAVDLLEYPWVVRPPVTFATTEELLEQLPAKVIAPAEEKHQARQKLLDELFGEN